MRAKRVLLAPKIEKFNNDWRCADSEDIQDWTKERRIAAILEVRLDSSDPHGDICRDAASKDFFCPFGCRHVASAPFCAIAKGPKKPCRVAPGEANHERCLNSEEPEITDEIKLKSLLQRHTESSSHGDVCRDVSTDQFFCPLGCAHVMNVPYCSENGRPCRIPLTNAMLSSGTSVKTINEVPLKSQLPLTSSTLSVTALNSRSSIAEPATHNQKNAETLKSPSNSVQDLLHLQIQAAAAHDFALVASLQHKIESLSHEPQQASHLLEDKSLGGLYSTVSFASSLQALQQKQTAPLTSNDFATSQNSQNTQSTVESTKASLLSNKNVASIASVEHEEVVRVIIPQQSETHHTSGLFNFDILVEKDSLLSSGEIFFFWNTPKAAANAVEGVLSSVNHMRTLPAHRHEDIEYLEKSDALRRGVISFLMTPHFADGCSLLGRAGFKGKAFTILREPVDRVISVLRSRKPQDPAKVDSVFIEYLFSPTSERNWLTLSLSSALAASVNANSFDIYDAANWILSHKMVVGFLDDLENSLKMICQTFGWQWNALAQAALVSPMSKDNLIASKDMSTAYYAQIAKLNSLDVRLYKEARSRYDASKNPSSPVLSPNPPLPSKPELATTEATQIASVVNSGPCTMHTYFAPKYDDSTETRAGHKYLLASWRKAWESSGWETRVLRERDVKSHPEYETFLKAFSQYPSVNTPGYDLACFVRHLAMAYVGGRWMSDYDVLPLSIPTCSELTNNGRFTLYQGFVPALISATGKEYLRVTQLLANLPWQKRKDIFSYEGQSHVSDMHAMIYLKSINEVSDYVTGDMPMTCGMLAASQVLIGVQGGPIRCLSFCPHPPQPSVSGKGNVGSKGLSGPLASHISHEAMWELQRSARKVHVVSVPQTSSNAPFLHQYPHLHEGLINLNGTTMETLRGQIIQVAPDAYKRACMTTVKTSRRRRLRNAVLRE